MHRALSQMHPTPDRCRRVKCGSCQKWILEMGWFDSCVEPIKCRMGVKRLGEANKNGSRERSFKDPDRGPPACGKKISTVCCEPSFPESSRSKSRRDHSSGCKPHTSRVGRRKRGRPQETLAILGTIIPPCRGILPRQIMGVGVAKWSGVPLDSATPLQREEVVMALQNPTSLKVLTFPIRWARSAVCLPSRAGPCYDDVGRVGLI
jgi:hypothetical protein